MASSIFDGILATIILLVGTIILVNCVVTVWESEEER